MGNLTFKVSRWLFLDTFRDALRHLVTSSLVLVPMPPPCRDTHSGIGQSGELNGHREAGQASVKKVKFGMGWGGRFDLGLGSYHRSFVRCRYRYSPTRPHSSIRLSLFQKAGFKGVSVAPSKPKSGRKGQSFVGDLPAFKKKRSSDENEQDGKFVPDPPQSGVRRQGSRQNSRELKKKSSSASARSLGRQESLGMKAHAVKNKMRDLLKSTSNAPEKLGVSEDDKKVSAVATYFEHLHTTLKLTNSLTSTVTLTLTLTLGADQPRESAKSH